MGQVGPRLPPPAVAEKTTRQPTKRKRGNPNINANYVMKTTIRLGLVLSDARTEEEGGWEGEGQREPLHLGEVPEVAVAPLELFDRRRKVGHRPTHRK